MGRGNFGVASQHVVVHVDGAAVVDGVTYAFGHDFLARVRWQTELEEASLSRWQSILSLWKGEKNKLRNGLE